VSADAEWCGQCFTSLREPEPEPATASPPPPSEPAAAPGSAAAARPAFWPCTVCGAENPIALDVCATCGTPFATVMRGAARRSVDPAAARKRSLLLPGAGHAVLGYPMDGFARGAVFVLSAAIALFLLLTVPHTALLLLAVGLLAAAAVGVYVLSLAETTQLSAGGGLIVPSRVLLWVAVGLMFLVVAVIALSIAGDTRR
jgi:hypothetical protein